MSETEMASLRHFIYWNSGAVYDRQSSNLLVLVVYSVSTFKIKDYLILKYVDSNKIRAS